MKLGLVGMNSITCLAVELLKAKGLAYELCIFDDNKEKWGKPFFGVECIGGSDQIEILYRKSELTAIHICLGEKHLALRKRLFDKYKTMGLEFPNLIDATSIISPLAKMGSGNLTAYGVILGHNTRINDNNVIWSGSVVEHDCTIRGSCYIGPNAVVSGYVEIGEGTLIGSGAVILPEKKIGKNCLIGAGAVVTKNVEDNKKVKGNPAR